AACRAAVAAYQQKHTVANLRPLLPCFDAPDPLVRALAFDKALSREVWDEPSFPALADQLQAAAAKGRRDKDLDVSHNADSMDWWLRNYRQYSADKADSARRKAQAAATAGRSDLSSPLERARIRLSFVFGAGVVVQVLIFVLGSGRTDLHRLGLAAAAGLFGLLPGRHESLYEPHFHIAFCFVVFAFVAFVQFKDDIMARVSESSLLVNSLTLWYLCVAFLGGLGPWLLALAALPTAGTLLVAFTVRTWTFRARLACYAWFLVLTAAEACFQVGFGNFSFLWSDSFMPPKAPDLFMTGMVFAVLAAALFYVHLLIPLRNKYETQEERMARWRGDAHEMAAHFSDYRLSASEALQILLLQGGFYLANHWLHLMEPARVMNVSLALLPLAVALAYRRGADPAPVMP
ncbi:MAG: hypothetical protein KGL53_07295, partial [Elusimicrobia bacterium]|nr:hypothetical protein [Elusimicrobiota bacterium]